jgi:hypothetical protein
MKIVFSTYCSDNFYDHIGVKKLIASAKHFHPEIPFITMKSLEINEEIKKDPTLNFTVLNPIMSIRLAEDYDLVVHFDADSMLVDRIDELLIGDYDVAGVRNNNDFGTTGCHKSGMCLQGVPVNQYLNVGLVASTRIDFWREWIDKNKLWSKNLPLHENDVMNLIFYSGKYKTKVMDPIEGDSYWGTSTQFGEKSHWDSWRKIQIKQDRLYLNNKRVKILHNAGGWGLPKLQFEKLCEPDILQWLERIYAS